MTKHGCKLFLVTPKAFDLQTLSGHLDAVLSEVGCASILLDMGDRDRTLIEEAASELMGIAFSHDTAFLIADAPEVALELGADGVHITTGIEAYRAARTVLGSDRIVGCDCQNSRHTAMEAGEAGADFVSFGTPSGVTVAAPEVIRLAAWWTELCEVPSVGFCDGTPATASGLVAAGVDYLGVREAVWNAKQGAVQAARSFVRLMNSDAAA